MDYSSVSIAIGDVTLNVVIAGEGPDVLLVHGFPDDHTVWRKTIPALVAAGYRVIAPDTRGCGESSIAAKVNDYRVETLVADLIGVLDQLGIAKVRLVAHDWGAAIAWQLVLAHPERVDRYAALAVGHPSAYAKAPIEQKIKGYYVLLLQLRGLIEWGLKLENWWLLRQMTRYPAETPRWIERLSRPGRLTAAINYYRANVGMVLPRPYPKASAKIMGIWSDGDLFLAESQMVATKAYVEGSFRYERIDGANHWAQLTAPDRVNAILLDFLKWGRPCGASASN